jgi:hypothetical protein
MRLRPNTDGGVVLAPDALSGHRIAAQSARRGVTETSGDALIGYVKHGHVGFLLPIAPPLRDRTPVPKNVPAFVLRAAMRANGPDLAP